MNEDTERTRLLGYGRSVTTSSTNDESGRWSVKWHPVYVILIATLLEKACDLSVRVNLVQFLEYHRFLGWHTTTATAVALVSTKATTMGAVASGFLADSYLGRYKVLLGSLILQFLGSASLGAAAVLESHVINDSEYKIEFSALVIGGLMLFGFGVAGAYGTEIPLGIDQYKPEVSGEEQMKAQQFFALYYWFLNVGGLIAISAVSMVQVNYRAIGFCISPVFSLLSIILLLACRKQLQKKETRKSSLKLVFAVCREAVRVWRRKGSQHVHSTVETATSLTSAWGTSVTAPWIRYAETSYGGRYSYNGVAKVHNFLAVVSILAATVFYQIIITQALTTFVSQGNIMRLPVHRNINPELINATNTTIIPASVFASVNPIAILIIIPFLYLFVYPQWAKVSNNLPPTQIQRIYAGMMAAFLSVAVAAIVEVERRDEHRWDWHNVTQRQTPGFPLLVSSLSIFYQVPQYFLWGAAEALSFISALELAYVHSPINMKGTCIGIVYAFEGVAAMMSVGIFILLHHSRGLQSWFYSRGKRGVVHYYFMALAGIILVGIVIFHMAARFFRPVPARLVSVEENDDEATATDSPTGGHYYTRSTSLT